MEKYAEIKIEFVTKDIVTILGVDYYSESYMKEMMDRRYNDGFSKGIRKEIHICEYVNISEPENKKTQ